MLGTPAIRHWRGVETRLTNYSSGELISELTCAIHTRAQVQVFIDAVERELARRSEAPESTA